MIMRMNFGEAVRLGRERLGWDQKALANMIGIRSRKTIRNYEKGHSIPNVETYFALCTVLGLSLNTYLDSPGWKLRLKELASRGGV